MSRVIIIGAGGVGTVIVHKMASMKVFGSIVLASRDVKKCIDVAEKISYRDILVAEVDASSESQLIDLFWEYGPDLVVNATLPYYDLVIMNACLESGVNYLDTACYEDVGKLGFGYKEQWALKDKFKKAGLTAILGCGFDPGVTGVFVAYAAKHHFDEIHTLDIVDCNGGDHGKPFATNFNPEINIREITQRGKYWSEDKWEETEPFEIKKEIKYPNIGVRDSYLIYHEELESLVKNFPSLRRARFFMTFGAEYLNHLKVIQNIGMDSIVPVRYGDTEIVPLQFLAKVLPKPEELGKNYTGETSIGVKIKGIKDDKVKTYYVYNNCKHEQAFKETGMQAISYTTGIPAVIGSMLFLTGVWKKDGVFNVEEFNPDPFMEALNEMGLPWSVEFNNEIEL